MVSSSLMGRFGNVLFQISAGYSLSLKNNDEFILNLSEMEFSQHTVDLYLKTVLRKINFTDKLLSIENIHREPHFNFSDITYLPNMKIHGYFQSEKYFQKHKKEIKNLFEIDEETLSEIERKYSEILKKRTCSIHVRRGDYLGLQQYHPLCDMTYFKEAMSKMPKGTKFLIFSDDINWCKENFVDDKFIFVEGNNEVTDLYLMSMCKHNIISNSSFSWWGAWLNKNKSKKVVAPKIWFGPSYSNMITDDLYCDKWIVC